MSLEWDPNLQTTLNLQLTTPPRTVHISLLFGVYVGLVIMKSLTHKIADQMLFACYLLLCKPGSLLQWHHEIKDNEETTRIKGEKLISA